MERIVNLRNYLGVLYEHYLPARFLCTLAVLSPEQSRRVQSLRRQLPSVPVARASLVSIVRYTPHPQHVCSLLLFGIIICITKYLSVQYRYYPSAGSSYKLCTHTSLLSASSPTRATTVFAQVYYSFYSRHFCMVLATLLCLSDLQRFSPASNILCHSLAHFASSPHAQAR